MEKLYLYLEERYKNIEYMHLNINKPLIISAERESGKSELLKKLFTNNISDIKIFQGGSAIQKRFDISNTIFDFIMRRRASNFNISLLIDEFDDKDSLEQLFSFTKLYPSIKLVITTKKDNTYFKQYTDEINFVSLDRHNLRNYMYLNIKPWYKEFENFNVGHWIEFINLVKKDNDINNTISKVMTISGKRIQEKIDTNQSLTVIKLPGESQIINYKFGL